MNLINNTKTIQFVNELVNEAYYLIQDNKYIRLLSIQLNYFIINRIQLILKMTIKF